MNSRLVGSLDGEDNTLLQQESSPIFIRSYQSFITELPAPQETGGEKPKRDH